MKCASVVAFFSLLLMVSASSQGRILKQGRNLKQINRFMPNVIILQLFELLRNVIKNGNEMQNIPVLDPYYFDIYNLSVHSESNIFKLVANFINGTVTGLGNFEVVKSNFYKENIELYLELKFPVLTFEAEQYDMKGTVMDLEFIKGNGKIRLQLNNLTILTNILLKQSEDEKSAIIKMIVKPGFNVESLESAMEFDNNMDKIANAMVEDVLLTYLNRFNRYIAFKISEDIVDPLNNFLSQFETWRFIQMLLD